MSPVGTLWHPQTHMPSADDDRLVIVSGEGAWVRTEDGRRLLDLPAGLWHANIGHGRERLARAAAEQMSVLETYHLFGAHANRPAPPLRAPAQYRAVAPRPALPATAPACLW